MKENKKEENKVKTVKKNPLKKTSRNDIKKRKKGFTLIEILAVIIIIGIIAIIAIPSISKYLNSSRDTVYTSYEHSMEEAAQNRVIDCLTNNQNCELPESEDEQRVYLDLLIDEGYLDNMKDPQTKNFCEQLVSYVAVKGDDASNYKFKACLYCGDYYTDDEACKKVETDGDLPECGNTVGESTRWTNQNRTITVACSDASSGCLQSVFSRTFTSTTTGGDGTITIRDRSGNAKECSVKAFVDKDLPTCTLNVEGEFIESVGWYSLTAKALLTEKTDADSGLLTYGMGTSVKNRDYNKQTELTVGSGITTVIGYVKDIAGNENICSADVRVGTEVPKFNVYYGYRVYPDKDPYVLSGITESGTNLTTTNEAPKITISSLSKYNEIEKVKITLKEAIDETTNGKITAGGVTKTGLMQQGSKEIIFVLPSASYPSVEITLGTIKNKTYKIDKIEVLTKNGNAWTDKKLTVYVDPVDKGMKTEDVSFENGATGSWITTFEKTFSVLTSDKIITRNGIQMQSNPVTYTARIDNTIPTVKVTATEKSSGQVIANGNWANEPLNFKFNQVAYGNSHGTIYYCQDTNNTCTPNIIATENAVITAYNTITSSYYVRYKIINEAEVSSEIESYHAQLDMTPPNCTSSGDSTTWTNGNRTISWGCSETSGSTCDPGFSGGSQIFSTTTKTATIAAYTIKDKAGNSTVCPARTANVYVDKTAPTCTNTGDSTTWTGSNRTITWGCNDADSRCDINYSGSSKIYSTTTKTASIAAYEIRDVAGNKVTCPARTANVYVDKTAPSCTNSGDSTTWTNANRTITWGCSDADQGSCTGTGSTTYSTTTKTATIAAYTVKDGVGNTATCPARTANVYVDKTAPTCTNSGDSTTWTKDNRTITWGCSDNDSKCNTSYNGSSKTFSTTTKTASIAAYEIRDIAGNKVTCPARTADVYVDKTAPSCTSGGDSTSWTKDNRTITWGCSDSDQGSCTGSGSQTFSSTTKTATIAAYTVKDGVGNTATCPARTANVYVDKTAPTCSVTKSNTGSTAGVTTTVTCSDSHSQCDTSRSATGETGKKNGTYTYKVYDRVGNEGSCSVTVTAQNQTRTKSCSAGNACAAAGCAQYNSCANSTCSVKTYKTCATSGCGVKSYNACASCGVQEYNTCANSACGVASYKTCATSGCGVAAYKTCATSGCGVAAYNRCASCGVASYNSCRTPGCGVESYASCNTSGCGVAQYNYCQNSACGAVYNTCQHSECGTYREYHPVCTCYATSAKASGTCSPGWSTGYQSYNGCSSLCRNKGWSSGGYRSSTGTRDINKTCATSGCGVAYYNSCRTAGCGVESYNYCQNSACGVASYKYCAHSECGVAQYNACASCGVAAYNSCANSACGVASYKTCAHSECGVASYKSCATSGCGVKSYKACASCGVKEYNSCANSACGVQEYNSCEHSSCGCKTNKTSIASCGCKTWGSFGNWTNVNSCSAGESGDHSTTTECRVVYN